MSRGVAVQTGSAASLGSQQPLRAATVSSIASAFDTSNNKVVIAFIGMMVIVIMEKLL